MRKVLYLIITFTILSQGCNDIQPQKPSIGKEQLRLLNIINQYKQDRDSAPNSAKKNEIYSDYSKKIKSFINDSLYNVLYRFAVKIDGVYNREWRGKEAFIFECSDDKIEYWSELHFKNVDSMRESLAYKTLSALKTGSTDTLSFAVLPDIELENDDYLAGLRMEVFVVPDSIALKLREKNKKQD